MKVLLAYDGLHHSDYALEETAQLALTGGIEVTVLSVVPPDARGSKSGGHVGQRPHAHEDVARAHKYLREKGIESEMKIAYGAPADEIVKEAKEGGYELIVVGSRGLGPVGKLITGSVSSKVLKKAPCGVLVAGEEQSERREAAVPA